MGVYDLRASAYYEKNAIIECSPEKAYGMLAVAS